MGYSLFTSPVTLRLQSCSLQMAHTNTNVLVGRIRDLVHLSLSLTAQPASPVYANSEHTNTHTLKKRKVVFSHPPNRSRLLKGHPLRAAHAKTKQQNRTSHIAHAHHNTLRICTWRNSVTRLPSNHARKGLISHENCSFRERRSIEPHVKKTKNKTPKTIDRDSKDWFSTVSAPLGPTNKKTQNEIIKRSI
ncbi:unnamed protein product, partial [Ectocarpus sp. 8 AP-2014]